MEDNKPNILQRIQQWIRGLSKLKLTALIALIVVLCIGTASALYYRHLSNMDKVFDDIDWGNNGDNEDNLDMESLFSGRKIINIALLGHDSSEARSKTRLKGYTGLVDTIMIAAIDIESGKIDIVSIPRDSLVRIYNHGEYKDKINSANYWGWSKGLPNVEDKVEAGIISQVETISGVLGDIPIHFYVTVDMDTVIEVVDIMGGVWYDVPARTYHNSGRIIAEPGYQHFNGRRFLDYVRSRVDGGDYQRTKKQQNVMIAVFQQFKQSNQLTNIPQVMLALKNKIRTNLSLEQIASLALFGTRKVDASKISSHTIEGTLKWGAIPGRATGNNYYLIDHKQRVKLIEEIWGKVVEPGPQDKLLPAKKEDIPKDDSEIGDIGEGNLDALPSSEP